MPVCLLSLSVPQTPFLTSPSPSLPFHSLPLCLPTVAFLPFLSGEPSGDSISLWVISALSWKLGYAVSDGRPVGPCFSSRAVLSNVHSGLLQSDLMHCDTSVMSRLISVKFTWTSTTQIWCRGTSWGFFKWSQGFFQPLGRDLGKDCATKPDPSHHQWPCIWQINYEYKKHVVTLKRAWSLFYSVFIAAINILLVIIFH